MKFGPLRARLRVCLFGEILGKTENLWEKVRRKNFLKDIWLERREEKKIVELDVFSPCALKSFLSKIRRKENWHVFWDKNVPLCYFLLNFFSSSLFSTFLYWATFLLLISEPTSLDFSFVVVDVVVFFFFSCFTHFFMIFFFFFYFIYFKGPFGHFYTCQLFLLYIYIYIYS